MVDGLQLETTGSVKSVKAVFKVFLSSHGTEDRQKFRIANPDEVEHRFYLPWNIH